MIERNIAPVLKHLASQYPVITLTGPRQSGKTTLANLLPRFIEPQGGRVLLDGLAHSKPPRILDACAAPGGKTLQLAAAGWQVTALDMSAKRLARMAERREKSNTFCVTTGRALKVR